MPSTRSPGGASEQCAPTDRRARFADLSLKGLPAQSFAKRCRESPGYVIRAVSGKEVGYEFGHVWPRVRLVRDLSWLVWWVG